MKREQKWVVPKTSRIPDPRIAIAKQLAWTRPLTSETDYSLPEPDHYNYAGLSSKIWDCPVIESQVFYWDRRLAAWWSVYYVPEDKVNDFLTWGDDIPFDFCWTPFRVSRMRHRRTLLKTRASAVEQTPEERLFTMGYYDKLQNTYNIDISSTLGEPRMNMPGGEYA
jgi:hypothetical protein